MAASPHETGEIRWHGICASLGVNRDIDERAFRLALQVIGIRQDDEYRRIVRWRVLAQLVDATTSIGANLAEAAGAQTKADFVAKVSIAKKEAFEAQYWLRLVDESHLLGDDDMSAVRAEAATVGRIISAIVRRAKASERRGPDA